MEVQGPFQNAGHVHQMLQYAQKSTGIEPQNVQRIYVTSDSMKMKIGSGLDLSFAGGARTSRFFIQFSPVTPKRKFFQRGPRLLCRHGQCPHLLWAEESTDRSPDS